MINITPIKKYLNNPIQNYKLVPIKYTKKEQNIIECLDINKYSLFNHYGNKSDIDNKKLNTFLDNLGSNKDQNLQILYKLIIKLLDKITKAFNTNFIWLTIRISLPNNNFDLKRWHKDGPFFVDPPQRIDQYKFVSILKGPGTLFMKDSKQINEIYENNILERRAEFEKTNVEQSFDDEITLKYRKKLANKLKKFKYNQLKNDEGLIFRTGCYDTELDNGVLHSEPKIDSSRFFISILPGTEKEINELIKRRNIKELTSMFVKNN